jgi:hypothetical protein
VNQREFMQGITDLVKEIDDPNSELSKFAKEGSEMAAEFAVHDPKFAGMVIDALVAFKQAGEYVKLTYGETVRLQEEERKAENIAATHKKKMDALADADYGLGPYGASDYRRNEF